MKKPQIKQAPQQPQNTVVVRFSRFFLQTWEKYKRDPQVVKAMQEFITFKKANHLAAFGSKDRFFKSSWQLQGFVHAGLTFDVSVIYKLSGRNPTTLYLYAVASHDDTGTQPGAGANLKRKQQFRQKLDQADFDTPVKPDGIKEAVEQKS